jgi:hypothetical protein
VLGVLLSGHGLLPWPYAAGVGEEREQRRRRRAVGPPGASCGRAPDAGLGPGAEPAAGERDDEERLARERPPHHDRGV